MDQVTPVLDVPVTVGVNSAVFDGVRVTVDGLRLMPIIGRS